VLVPAIWWNRTHPLAESGDLALRDRTAGAADGLTPAVRAEDTLAKARAASATESTVNLADNNQSRSNPRRRRPLKRKHQSRQLALHKAALRPSSPSKVSKGFDKEIASAKIQAAPAAAPAAVPDSKAKSDTLAGVAPPVAQPSSAASLGTKQQFFPTIRPSIFSQQCAGNPVCECLEHFSSSATRE